MQTINNAFVALGLAPAAESSTTTAAASSGAVKVSSEDAIHLEEEYSAHK